MAKKKKNKYTSIGGQALMEGIMMRGPEKCVMACRRADGSIYLETVPLKKKTIWQKIPIVRGVFNFIDSMMSGSKTLMRSAEIAIEDEDAAEAARAAAAAKEDTRPLIDQLKDFFPDAAAEPEYVVDNGENFTDCDEYKVISPEDAAKLIEGDDDDFDLEEMRAEEEEIIANIRETAAEIEKTAAEAVETMRAKTDAIRAETEAIYAEIEAIDAEDEAMRAEIDAKKAELDAESAEEIGETTEEAAEEIGETAEEAAEAAIPTAKATPVEMLNPAQPEKISPKSKKDKKAEKQSDGLGEGFTFMSVLLGVALAMLLFVFLPTWCYSGILLIPGAAEIFEPNGEATVWKSVIEGVVKIIIFLVYILLCSTLKEIRRVFQYHGAEHKCIFCYEAGLDLTVENVKKFKRFHPRCGTSFIILMVLVGVIAGICISWFLPQFDSFWIRPLIKIAILPLVMGVGYELLKLCGKHDNIITKLICAPGLWMQRITTREPDDGQIECAIAALKPVIPENGEDLA